MTDYEPLFEQLNALKAGSRGNLFQIAKLALRISNNKKFQKDVLAGNASLDRVDDVLRETGFEFCQLREMLVDFPHASQWKKGDLKEMLFITNKRLKGSPPTTPKTISNGDKPKQPRHTATIAQTNEFKSEIEKLNFDNKSKDEQIALLKGQVQSLELQLKTANETIAALQKTIEIQQKTIDRLSNSKAA